MAPVLLLLVIPPLVAEFLLGDVTLASLPALVLFIPLYGGGALLIREVVRRRGGGWPAIVVFAAAFGVVEEGLATQSLFNPDYAHQHLLSSGFLPALGIAIPWTVYVLSLHVIWSICTPIALVESMFPSRRTEPWLRTPGRSSSRCCTCLVYLPARLRPGRLTSTWRLRVRLGVRAPPGHPPLRVHHPGRERRRRRASGAAWSA